MIEEGLLPFLNTLILVALSKDKRILLEGLRPFLNNPPLLILG